MAHDKFPSQMVAVVDGVKYVPTVFRVLARDPDTNEPTRVEVERAATDRSAADVVVAFAPASWSRL
jgi:hypothetical protein